MIFEMPSCGGCKTCELACSFKHKKEFRPSISSIEIITKEKDYGYSVMLVEENDDQRIACDGCKDLDMPMCVQHCEKQEELQKILKEFWEFKQRS